MVCDCESCILWTAIDCLVDDLRKNQAMKDILQHTRTIGLMQTPHPICIVWCNVTSLNGLELEAKEAQCFAVALLTLLAQSVDVPSDLLYFVKTKQHINQQCLLDPGFSS